MWTKNGKNWITEISELPEQKLPIICPNCHKSFTSYYNINRDTDKEIIHWAHGCSCGIRIIIFND